MSRFPMEIEKAKKKAEGFFEGEIPGTSYFFQLIPQVNLLDKV
jgi:hypothetical protein